MINVFLYDNKLEFDNILEYCTDNKFKKVKNNMIGKFDATLIKIGDRYFACERVTIIHGAKITDLIVDGSWSEIVSGKSITKNEIKKIRKIRDFYNRQFQFGMEYSKLDILFESQQALKKYKLMLKNNFKFKEVQNA